MDEEGLRAISVSLTLQCVDTRGGGVAHDVLCLDVCDDGLYRVDGFQMPMLHAVCSHAYWKGINSKPLARVRYLHRVQFTLARPL